MLIEPSTTPTRLPLPNQINGWAENVALWANPATQSAITFGWNAIPQMIRDRFTKPLSGTNKGIRIYLGGDMLHEEDNTETAWSGLYIANGPTWDPGPRLLLSLDNTVWESKSLVHEFGHHVDYTYHRLWGSDLADESIKQLTTTGPLSGLYAEASTAWATWQAAAPDDDTFKNFSPYGFANSQEWFAELFAYWLIDTSGHDNYTGQAQALLILAGMDISRQQRIHDAFKAFLPDMPPMPGL
jgi:hypothetical protein